MQPMSTSPASSRLILEREWGRRWRTACVGLVLLGSALGAGCDSDAEPALDIEGDLPAYLETARESIGAPALAAATLRDGDVTWAGTVGQASLEPAVSATAETVFLVASVSKAVTALVVMTLVEDGTVDLDADISSYLPFDISVPGPAAGGAPITLRHLLTHTSGIVDTHYDAGGDQLYTYGADTPISLADVMRGYLESGGAYYDASTFVGTTPGTAFAYSNLGLALAGYVAEAAAGVPFEVLSQDRIFAPLGLTRTAWRLRDLEGATFAVPHDADLEPYGLYTFPDYPNGGLWTSATDLSRLLRAVVNGGQLGSTQILVEAALDELLRIQLPSVPGAERQALGWHALDPADVSATDSIAFGALMGHDGSESGVATMMYANPATGDGFLLFANVDLGTDEQSEAFLEAFRTGVLGF